jgi:AF1548-like protein
MRENNHNKQVVLLPEKSKSIFVTKADGCKAPFESGKVESTCIRAGASPFLARRIAQYVEDVAYNGIRTREIYKLVLAALAGETDKLGIKHRYRLKESLMLLGPAGFNFERYIGRLLSECGYRVDSIRSTVIGRCISHEIDLEIYSLNYATKIMVECKYHNFAGAYTGLKEALYTHARFLDIRENEAKRFDGEMLVSNTRISKEALRYAACVGQEALTWNHPPNRGIERLIEETRLYPITILKLNTTELQSFAKIGIMVARTLAEGRSEEISRKTGIRIERVMELQELARRIVFR